MVPDPSVIGSGDSPQFGATFMGLEELHLLTAMAQEAVLEVYSGERCRKVAQIGSRSPDQAGELTERPVGGRDRLCFARNDEAEALGIVHASLDADVAAFDDACACAVSATANALIEVVEGEEFFVVGARKPFGRDPSDVATAGYVDLVGA